MDLSIGTVKNFVPFTIFVYLNGMDIWFYNIICLNDTNYNVLTHQIIYLVIYIKTPICHVNYQHIHNKTPTLPAP